VICASGLPLQATQLTSAEASFEGRLARLVLGLEGGDGTVTLSRQGPPDRRDLVIEIPGATAAPGLPGHSASDALLPWAISSSPGGSPALRIVLEGLGDSLVKMESVPASLSLLLIPPEPGAVELTGSYRVGSDDVLAVSVFGHEDLTKTSKVGPDGQIKLPLIGNVRAAGRTVDAIADEIEERLGEEFLVDPHVTVSVWEYLSQWVNVMGEVNKPGRYYMTGQTTLVDAVSMAGGLKPSAGDTILVTRRPMESEPEAAGQIIRFSASAMMGNEQDAAGFTLRPGDVVNVAVGEFVYLEGEVRSPGAYALSRDTTLLGAVGMAGGFAPGVEDAVLDLIRDDGGRRERTSYSSRELKEGSDPVVRPGDVVVVRRRS
jgi:polysaccharide export outer membrane protein